MKKVAVIIPFYNGSAFITRALESVSGQTRRADEIIIVDDGSSPEEHDFVEDLARKYGAKFISQENSGQSSSRNLGVQNCQADLICFLDQDDYFALDHIEVLWKALDESNGRFAFSYGDSIRETLGGITLHRAYSSSLFHHPATSLLEALKRDYHILPSATLIRKEVFESLGGFDERLRGYEDDDLFTRFFAKGWGAVFVDSPVVTWTYNLESSSHQESMAHSRLIYANKIMDTYGNGALGNVDVVRDIVIPRFGWNFAVDVLSSSFLDKGAFEAARNRLLEFRNSVQRNAKRFLTGFAFLNFSCFAFIANRFVVRAIAGFALPFLSLFRSRT